MPIVHAVRAQAGPGFKWPDLTDDERTMLRLFGAPRIVWATKPYPEWLLNHSLEEGYECTCCGCDHAPSRGYCYSCHNDAERWIAQLRKAPVVPDPGPGWRV